MNQIKCLDHGFVRLLNLAGPVRRPDQSYDADDIDPAKTARISFNNFESKRSRSDDLRLVKYLMKNKHNTPIEMIEVWIEMKLPIFVARQFVRHRTACINEVSARYTKLPGEWYIPETIGGKPTGGAKQGQSDTLGKCTQWIVKLFLRLSCYVTYQFYRLAMLMGVAPEHARMFLHVNHYTHWVWKQDLHNLVHFLNLRVDPHAQIEAQIYGAAIEQILRRHLPAIMEIRTELKNGG